MRAIGIPLAQHRRSLIIALVLFLASPLLALVLVRSAPALRVEIGPSDRPYVHGLSAKWFWEGDSAWRTLSRRSRVRFPATVAGPGVFALALRWHGQRPASLRVHFDDETTYDISVPPATNEQRIAVELPPGRVRAHVRIRFESSAPEEPPLKVSAAEWVSRRARPQTKLLRASSILLVGTFIALVVSGMSRRVALAASLVMAAALVVWTALEPSAGLHLLVSGAPVVLLGTVVVTLARLASPKLRPALLVLFFITLLFRAGLLFHPSFYFYDMQLHETLVELAYHRGTVDFWNRWPEYHGMHGLGLSPVAGVRQSFPYPILFHMLTHLVNSLVHAPVFWLKLLGALFAALSLFPVAYLARRLCPLPGAEIFAGVFYLFIPTLTPSLLLLKFDATAGHLFDLCVVAYLAHVSLRLDSGIRWATGVLAISTSLAAYTSGFIHIGLLLGSCLLLIPVIGGLNKKDVVRLAAAGLIGLALALVTYQPHAVKEFATSLLLQQQSEQAQTVGAQPEFLVSSLPAIDSLGIPLLVLGFLGAATVIRGLPTSLKLLFYSWIVSAITAHGLRFIFPELLLHQKELYWAGAALAVLGGGFLARLWSSGRRGYVLAALALAASFGAWLRSFSAIHGYFYGPYLFL